MEKLKLSDDWKSKNGLCKTLKFNGDTYSVMTANYSQNNPFTAQAQFFIVVCSHVVSGIYLFEIVF